MDLDLKKLIKSFKKKNLFLSFDFNDEPSEIYGGSWERVEGNYALWTTVEINEGGNKITAGLPNINGWTNDNFQGQAFGNIGALKFDPFSVEWGFSSTGQGAFFGGLNFDASKGETKLDGSLRNDVYGKSDTVQPPAYKVII